MIVDIFAVIGVLSVVGILVLVIAEVIDVHQGEDYFIFKLFGFGWIKVREGSRVCDNLNSLRGSEGKTVFFDAPRWFNKHVYNFGVRPK